MRLLCQKVLTFHWTTTFILIGAFSALGAAASFNLFIMLGANFRFLSEHGVMAVMEGALAQLGELALNALSPSLSISASRPASGRWWKNCWPSNG